MPKKKQLTPPLYKDLFSLYMLEIYDDINIYFGNSMFKDMYNRMHLSFFIENCLGINVMKDSANLYKELAE